MGISTGAHESYSDTRTIELESTLGVPLVNGGIKYLPTDIENQHTVGICTAISRVQLRQKQSGKKYSPDFQYLCQKTLYDNNWQEGSSILVANKVAKNIGFLPIELFPYVTESDRTLPYSQYVAKLKVIPLTEIERLITLCVDKIAGYASVDVTSPQAIANAISNSTAGILCRYNVDEKWWLPSWASKDIDPLRAPTNPTSGHAIIMSSFDYSTPLSQILANTWGVAWNKEGCADINWNTYKPTEAWADLDVAPVIPKPSFHYNFMVNLSFGQTSVDIGKLQQALQLQGLFPSTQAITNYYGSITASAVLKFRSKYSIPSDTDPFGHSVGPLTRTQLNKLYN